MFEGMLMLFLADTHGFILGFLEVHRSGRFLWLVAHGALSGERQMVWPQLLHFLFPLVRCSIAIDDLPHKMCNVTTFCIRIARV